MELLPCQSRKAVSGVPGEAVILPGQSDRDSWLALLRKAKGPPKPWGRDNSSPALQRLPAAPAEHFQLLLAQLARAPLQAAPALPPHPCCSVPREAGDTPSLCWGFCP